MYIFGLLVNIFLK